MTPEATRSEKVHIGSIHITVNIRIFLPAKITSQRLNISKKNDTEENNGEKIVSRKTDRRNSVVISLFSHELKLQASSSMQISES